MSSKTRYILFSAVTLFVFVLSLATPITTYAEEGTPPVDAPATEPGAAPDSPSSEEAPAAEPDSNSAAQPSSEPGAASDSPSSEAPAAEPASDSGGTAADPTTDAPAAEPILVPEILAQVPDQTQVVVINPDGTTEPLATQAAADAITTGDPMWCPEGVAPGGVGCSGSYTTLTGATGLLTNFDITAQTQNGAIWIENYNFTTETAVTINSTNSYNLTLQGGWNGILGSTTVTGFSTYNVPIQITWGGNLTLNNIIVNAANGTGAYLDTCAAVGGVCTGTGSITVTNSQFNNNVNSSGLFVNSANNVTFTNVNANGNGYYGADLVDHTAAGDVQITGSNFSNNDDKGLSVITNGRITLNNVNANNNRDGAYLDALNDINITNSNFGNLAILGDANTGGNTWTGLYILTPGNVVLDNVSASYNGVTGAYIDARSGIGGITVRNGSTFFSNGDLGLKGMTGKGAISLTNVTIDGDNDTDRGAWLKTFDGGNVLVQNSLFQNNLGDGFEIISSGKVDLVNTQATTNGANGGDVYSTWSYACFGPRGIVVTADAGAFQNNGGYGLYVSPGPEGSFVRLNNPLFAGNLLGNFFLDLEDHCIAGPCTDPGTTPDPKPTPEKKPINEVIVPETGGEPVAQDCENTSGTLLEFENGTSVKVGCPFSGESQIEAVEKDKLPHELPVGPNFVSAVSVDLTKDGQHVEGMTEGGKITLSFKIPADMKNGHFSILYWDPNAKDGAGDWVELPLDQFGGAEFPLNPDDPNDKRTIFSGLEVHGDTVTVTVNFPGVFALVSR
jgi:hypothetical protein